MASERIRVLLVDDHARVRQALRKVLANYDDLEVVGEAENGEDAVTMVSDLSPAVVVMDISMPKMNGIEATARIKSQKPSVLIIGLSTKRGQYEDAIIRAGATAFLTKQSAGASLYVTILKVLEK